MVPKSDLGRSPFIFVPFVRMKKLESMSDDKRLLLALEVHDLSAVEWGKEFEENLLRSCGKTAGDCRVASTWTHRCAFDRGRNNAGDRQRHCLDCEQGQRRLGGDDA